MRSCLASVALVALVWLGCSGDSDAPLQPGSPDAPVGPELSIALSGRCFGWPTDEFTIENAATTQIGLTVGELAVEFTLRDLDGNAYTLSKLLATKPVLLVTGSYT